jgi:hypothetical protein
MRGKNVGAVTLVEKYAGKKIIKTHCTVLSTSKCYVAKF